MSTTIRADLIGDDDVNGGILYAMPMATVVARGGAARERFEVGETRPFIGWRLVGHFGDTGTDTVMLALRATYGGETADLVVAVPATSSLEVV